MATKAMTEGCGRPTSERTRTASKRQQEALKAFAKGAGYELVDEFYDPAVSGADAIDERPGFAAMLKRIAATASG